MQRHSYAVYSFAIIFNYLNISDKIFLKEHNMKKIITYVVAALMVFSLSACGGSSSASSTPTPKVYVSDEKVSSALSNPDDYKDQYIVLTGKIFNVIGEDKDGNSQYQAYHDIENYDQDFVFIVPAGGEKLNENDYVSVDGQILGKVSGENMLGSSVEALAINADTVTKLSFIDAVVPTISSIEPNMPIEQNGVTVSVDKVEFAEKETRVYVTETNNSADNFNLWTYEAAIIQNGTQINLSSSDSAYEGEYPEISSSLLPGASSTGILVFDPVDSTQGFQITIPCSSDNYDLDMQPFVFDIAAAQ